MNRRALIFPILLALATACASDQPAPTADDPPATPSAAAAPAADPGLAPIATHGGAPATGGSEIVTPGAVFTLPAGWQQQQPKSRMRLAQAQIPGDAGAAELTVFFFGVGGGGGVQSNLDRWISQVELDPGTSPQGDAFAVGPFQVTTVEVQGTLKPSTMGTGPTTPQPGSMLLGAVVEGPGGPWFFKSTGPAGTLEAQRDAFFALLRSAKSQA